MANDKITFTIAEVTIESGKTATVNFDLDGKHIRIPVDEDVKAYFNDQFVRPKPTKLQSKRFATVMNILRAAYRKGLEDGGDEANAA